MIIGSTCLLVCFFLQNELSPTNLITYRMTLKNKYRMNMLNTHLNKLNKSTKLSKSGTGRNFLFAKVEKTNKPYLIKKVKA